MKKNCQHASVECLNQYDTVRKYSCADCGEVMMCSCDRSYGERFLPQQLRSGPRLNTQERVPVTIGFQDSICQQCRGEKPIAAPMAPTFGASSKITRYYWREISMETHRRFYDRNPDLDPLGMEIFSPIYKQEYKRIQKEVIKEIKDSHETEPKYEYGEISQQEVIDTTGAEVIRVPVEHVKGEERKVGIRKGGRVLSAEEFATEHFEDSGYNVHETESVPFHTLFGIFMYLLVGDPEDSNTRIGSFGNRDDYEKGLKPMRMISIIKPNDFGTSGYFERRKTEIETHFTELDDYSDLEELEWLFDLWSATSADFRQYLWAHREKDLEKARSVMKVLGLENLKKVLRYMVRNYWENFCGWPDLLVFDDSGFFFCEVKSSKDRLSEEQKNWLLGNHKFMNFPAKILKLTKKL